MLKTRVIPCLLLVNEGLVKTVKFKDYNYIGDPINTVLIFNELEVDELIFLDIKASQENRKPEYSLLSEIATQCFMPLTYGGGIKTIDEVKEILSIGYEKVAININAYEAPTFITRVAEKFGSQCVVASIDVRKNLFGKYDVYVNGGKKNTKKDPVEWAKQMETLGAGEILLTSIDRDGTWKGYDDRIVKKVVESVNIPVIACGGAGNINDFSSLVEATGVNAVAAGSLFVYQKKDLGVLINYPSRKELDKLLS